MKDSWRSVSLFSLQGQSHPDQPRQRESEREMAGLWSTPSPLTPNLTLRSPHFLVSLTYPLIKILNQTVWPVRDNGVYKEFMAADHVLGILPHYILPFRKYQQTRQEFVLWSGQISI